MTSSPDPSPESTNQNTKESPAPGQGFFLAKGWSDLRHHGDFFALLCYLLGAGSLVFALITAIISVSFLDGAQKAEARLVSVQIKQNSIQFTAPDSGVMTYPELEFEASDGKNYRFTSAVANHLASTQRLTGIPVLYRPENPVQARVDDLMGVWGLSLIGLGLGIFVLLCGLSLAYQAKKHRERLPTSDA